MKISDFLERHELSGAELSKQLGYTGAEAVNSRRRKGEDIPEAWLPRLAELGYAVDGLTATPPQDDEQYREAEFGPTMPPGAPQAPPQIVQIDYRSIAGHIEGAYKLTAQMAIRPSDPLLADVVEANALAAGQAWARWIESEPKVAALLQRMMVGTPLGEVIFVHVGIIISYTAARASQRSATLGGVASANDGSPETDGAVAHASEDPLA